MCIYKTFQLKPNSKTHEPDRVQHDRPDACVIAQQYSSATSLSLRFHYPKEYFKKCVFNFFAPGIAQTVWRLATGWTVRGSNPGGGEIFRTRPNQAWSPPSLLYGGYRVSYLRVQRPACGVDHPPLSSAEVKRKITAIPLLTIWTITACYRVHFTITCIFIHSFIE